MKCEACEEERLQQWRSLAAEQRLQGQGKVTFAEGSREQGAASR